MFNNVLTKVVGTVIAKKGKPADELTTRPRHLEDAPPGHHEKLGVQAAGKKPMLSPKAEFKALDRNHDGTFSKDEWMATSLDPALFGVAEGKADSGVNAKEWQALRGTQEEFRKLDRSGDGRISKFELAGPPQRIWPGYDREAAARHAKMDTNRDGGLSQGEYLAGLQMEAGRRTWTA